MSEIFGQLTANSINILVLLAVALFHKIIGSLSRPPKFSIFAIYCQQFALRVNKPNRSNSHKKIAGFIATTITWLPIIIILWLFESLIEVPWLWGSLLLYISLDKFQLNKIAQQEFQLLNSGNKHEAKKLIAPVTLRDTDQLSPVGISKSTIEMLILRKLQLQFCVGFYFLLFGPLAAVSYRLILELHHQWNIKRANHRAFGKFPHTVTALLQWLPSRLFLIFMFIISIRQPIRLLLRIVKQSFFKLNNNVIVHFFALELGIKLGGVAMYDGEKLRRVSFNDHGLQPKANHIMQAVRYLNLVMTLIIGLLVSYVVIIASLTIK